MTTATAPTPTAAQIATLDPETDFDAAWEAGVTFTHRAQHIKTVACPAPRCTGWVGESCRTPNGRTVGFHKVRVDLSYGRTKVTTRPHRLTDPQADAIERMAEAGELWAPGKWANFRGDRARRAVADALVAHGYASVHRESEHGERCLRLTADGWRTYWHHRRVIRRLPDEQHEATCPCADETKEN